jgi:hypothetical protein
VVAQVEPRREARNLAGSRFLDLRVTDHIPLRIAHHVTWRIGKRNLAWLTLGKRVVPRPASPVGRLLAWSGAPLPRLFLFSLVHRDAPSVSQANVAGRVMFLAGAEVTILALVRGPSMLTYRVL